MRELKRSIARNLMKMHGVEQINKKRLNRSVKGKHKKVSFFSLHWKEYLDPESKYRKSLDGQLKRDAAMQTRRYGKRVPAPWPVPR